MEKICIIGGGNMGRTYAESFTANHTVLKKNLYILEHYEDKLPDFKQRGFESVFAQPGDYIRQMDLIILAVKPQDFPELAVQLKPYLNAAQVVLSIMAGVTMQAIHRHLGLSKIIRAMPNLPAQIGMGMTGFTSAAQVGKEELFTIHNLLSTTGKALYFDDESKLDAVTAVSGSGPAYVYYFMDAMIESAAQMGFTTTQAEMLVEQTFMGAIHLFANNNFSCKEWIAKVASKGGTTEAALKQFEAKAVAAHIGQGLESALLRARELGK
jgi:pyrroline-5-carboxylate reductase